ncbi:MAG: rhomboid family intramembrane serine protease [Gemmatimonadota bacterium]|nr:rhomboid family intramembrane serine protease [Gemmatimonadota bacterium]
MHERHGNHLTPWVGRLMAINAVVLVLLLTVFTAPRFTAALQFDPAALWARPWTILTHLFIHLGPLHLAVNLLVLWVFGPGVENRIGGRRFLLLYLSCGLGAALFAIGLTGVAGVPPLVGAGGAVLGVALAAALVRPDAQLAIFSVPLSAATVVAVLGVLDLLAAFRFADDGLAHLAHAGGVIAAYAWFRFRQLDATPAPTTKRGLMRTVMAAPVPLRRFEGATVVPPPQERPVSPLASAEFERAEMDRVLDKISSSGLSSLTAAEKRFLHDASERRTKPHD